MSDAANRALYHANMLVKSGMADCALALGFEQMSPGSLGTNFPDRKSPLEPWVTSTIELNGTTAAHGPITAQMFGNAGQEYLDKHGGTRLHLAKIGAFPLHRYVPIPNAIV